MKIKKVFLAGAAVFAATTVLGTTGVYAAEDKTVSDTTVTYNNQSVVPGDSGVWGIVIPTAVSFSDGAGEKQNFSVELVGVNGYELDDLHADLRVQVSATSQEGYKLSDGKGNTADYEVSYTKTNSQQAITTGTSTAKSKTQVAELSKTTAKSDATATLKRKPTVKGAYKDKIKYSIAHTGSELK
ncbi:hypothetical protein M2454_000072 [Aequitasia blattaphilus]|uniref:Uncharacterized protein n=1 Tax=Aequitasia blattaphilus TaxID=2949332 RepID=A0ABT1E4U4_9FIRM|nr:hypothetical protein [Aequitasia blattaphilus]MCP1100864.1 hypothetical protein [Aequitasia blattaphilus]MCR8613504.1 hypothetical protein [Aequitasia blattaphilus]